MTDEKYRAVSGRLRRLAALERLAWAGAEEMFELVSAVCARLNQDLGGDIPALTTNPATLTARWAVAFLGRDVLDFEVTTRSMPAVSNAVARCSVQPHLDALPLSGYDSRIPVVFHYVKTNDHGRWDRVTDDLSGATPVTPDMILDVIKTFANDKLKLYPRCP